MAAKNQKVEEMATITNTVFASQEDKVAVRVAGICKEIEDKETSSGTAKRFRGDFAVELEKETYRAKNLFLPNSIRDEILSQVSKLGKWSSFEFVAKLKRIKTANEAGEITSNGWEVSFTVPCRVEKPRVLSLLDA